MLQAKAVFEEGGGSHVAVGAGKARSLSSPGSNTGGGHRVATTLSSAEPRADAEVFGATEERLVCSGCRGRKRAHTCSDGIARAERWTLRAQAEAVPRDVRPWGALWAIGEAQTELLAAAAKLGLQSLGAGATVAPTTVVQDTDTAAMTLVDLFGTEPGPQ